MPTGSTPISAGRGRRNKSVFSIRSSDSPRSSRFEINARIGGSGGRLVNKLPSFLDEDGVPIQVVEPKPLTIRPQLIDESSDAFAS
jgi:hypothetical protein